VTSTVAYDAMPQGRPLLETLAVPIPPEAEPGVADLVIMSGARRIVLGNVDVLGDVHIYDPPSFEVAVGDRVGQVATLLGGDLEPGKLISPGMPVTLTLVWRADTAAADQELKIFTHLMGASGDILAQHDGQPANWSRPTTGWLADEIIVDTHVLAWSPGAAERVTAGDDVTLLLGMYDGATGVRIVWQDGADALVFPLTLTLAPARSE